MNQPSLALYNSFLKPASRLAEVPILLAFNLVLIASAYLSITLPFSPVPITGQTLGVLLIAMTLGRARGVGIVLAYLVEGAAGLPVFAGGKAGIAIFFGPTAGYLLGFLVAAYVVGTLADRGWHTGYVKSLGAMILGTAIILISGASWLATVVPAASVWAMGIAPFLPGAAIKIALAAAVLPTVCRFVGKE